jgi:hypothetical protein
MAVLHVHEAASPPPRAPSLHGGACGMHDKIACAKRNNTKYQRKSIYIALQPRELARQPATMRAWRASYFNSLCGVRALHGNQPPCVRGVRRISIVCAA